MPPHTPLILQIMKLRPEEGKRLCPRPQNGTGRTRLFLIQAEHSSVHGPFFLYRSQASTAHCPTYLITQGSVLSHAWLRLWTGSSGPGSLCFKNLSVALAGSTVGNTLTKEGRGSDYGIFKFDFQKYGCTAASHALFEMPTRSHRPFLTKGGVHQPPCSGDLPLGA